MSNPLFEFPHQAAKPKVLERLEDAPTHETMRAGIRPVDRRAPSSDQKKVRTQQRRKTAELGEPERTDCPKCGTASFNEEAGYCPQCGYHEAAKHAATTGDLWDDLDDGGDTSTSEASMSWYTRKPGDIADSSGQGKSGLPQADEAEKDDCGARDKGLVCVRPKGHDGVHDFQPQQYSKAAAREVTCNSCGATSTDETTLGKETCPVCGSSDLKRSTAARGTDAFYNDDDIEMAHLNSGFYDEDKCPRCGAVDSFVSKFSDEGQERAVEQRAEQNGVKRSDVTTCTSCGVSFLNQRGLPALASKTAAWTPPTNVDFGSVYGGTTPSYMTPDGPVWMFRKGQKVRFYDEQGRQVGPEQANVAPAVAYAHSVGWDSGLMSNIFGDGMTSAKVAALVQSWDEWRRIVQFGYHSLMGSYIESDHPEPLPRQLFEAGTSPEVAIQALCGDRGKPVSVMDAMQAVDKAGQHHNLWAASKTAAEHDATPQEGREGNSPTVCATCGKPIKKDGDTWVHAPEVPTHPAPSKFSNRSQSMNPNIREAEVLQAMAKATPAERKDLAKELEDLRSARRASIQEERDLQWSTAVIRDTLTPVATHQHHTADTDWIGDIADEATIDDATEREVKAEATLWFQRTHEAVRADHAEFLEQALGMGRREASLRADITGRVERTFVEHACHLAGVSVTYDDVDGGADNAPFPLNQANPARPQNWPITTPGGVSTNDAQDLAEIPGVAASLGDGSMWDALVTTASPGVGDADPSGQGVSSLPKEVPLGGHEDVLDNFQPPVAPVNEGIAYQEPTSEDAPIVQENMQEQPEHSTGGGNAGQIADPSGQGQSKLPQPNDQTPAHTSAKVLAEADALRLRSHPDYAQGWGAGRAAAEAGLKQAVAVEGSSEEFSIGFIRGIASISGPATLRATGIEVIAYKDGDTATCHCGKAIEYHDHSWYHLSKDGPINWDEHGPETYPGKKEGAKEAAAPIADESGQGVSSLPQVDESEDEVMWPWELEQNKPGTGAAGVDGVHTPGQQVADYPQPKAGSLTPEQQTFRDRVQAALRG